MIGDDSFKKAPFQNSILPPFLELSYYTKIKTKLSQTALKKYLHYIPLLKIDAIKAPDVRFKVLTQK